MKRNFGNKTVLAPLPVLIVATYDEQGTPNAMNVAWGGQCGYHHVALNLSFNQMNICGLRASPLVCRDRQGTCTGTET